MGCGHVILLAEDARGSWRAVFLSKVGYILTTEKRSNFSFFKRAKKGFDFNSWHLEHVLNLSWIQVLCVIYPRSQSEITRWKKSSDVVTLVQFLVLISPNSPFCKVTSFDKTLKREITLD